MVLFTHQMKHCTCTLTLTLIRVADSCGTPQFVIKTWTAAVTRVAAGVVLALTLES